MFLALVVLAPRVASAQAKKGDKEFQIFANVFTTIQPTTTIRIGTVTQTFGGTSSTGLLFLNAGLFVTDRMEVGGGPTITISSDDPKFDTGINLFFRDFFGAQSAMIKPYVGGQYQIRSFNTDNGSLSDNQFLAVLFGVRDYLSAKVALDVNGSYGFNPINAGDLQLLTVQIGFTVLF